MKDLPAALLAEGAELVKLFATAFLVDGRLVGSGTFARVHGRVGILTAGHVWEAIDGMRHRFSEVSLVAASGMHAFSVPIEHLTPHIHLRRESDPWGPDFQFVELPAAKIGDIQARKAFAELTTKSADYRAMALRSDGFAAVAGFPAAFADENRPSGNGPPVTTIRGGFSSTFNRHFVRGDYDYLETTADQTLPDLPRTYGGVSGAGVWRILIRKPLKAPISEARIENYVLAGVAYYEEPDGPEKMTIRYHGPETVYTVINRLVPA